MSTPMIVVLACANPVTLVCLALCTATVVGVVSGRRATAAQALMRELIAALRALRRR